MPSRFPCQTRLSRAIKRTSVSKRNHKRDGTTISVQVKKQKTRSLENVLLDLIPWGFPFSIDVFIRPLFRRFARSTEVEGKIEKIFRGRRDYATFAEGEMNPRVPWPFLITTLLAPVALSYVIEPDNDGYIIHGWLRAIPRNPRKPSSRSTDQTLLCADFSFFSLSFSLFFFALFSNHL